MTHTAQVTRTRQDLINTGEAFGKMEEKFEGSSSSSELSRRREYKSNGKKRLAEFCYSISNLMLIVASVIALCVLIKFIQDDPFYEYGEHLLSLQFYRQLIYIMVLLPLVLLLPILNALSALLLASRATKSASLVRLKLAYQMLMFLLVLLALVFVAPYIRASNLSSQLELEFRKHMKYRYEKQFSYEFIEQIQESYECCDEIWYRANFNDQLPSSCFVPGTNLSQIYDQTCANALGSLISIRCSIIAGCLLLSLACLACLLATDFGHSMALSPSPSQSQSQSQSQPSRYKINNAQSAHRLQLQQEHQEHGQQELDQPVRINSFRKRDEHHQEHPDESSEAQRGALMIGGQHDPINELLRKSDCAGDQHHQHLLQSSGFKRLHRLKSDEERERRVPLLDRNDLSNDHRSQEARARPELATHQERAQNASAIDLSSPFHNFDEIDDDQAPASSERKHQPVVLARANLRLVERDRSQSPLLESSSEFARAPPVCAQAGSSAKPIKSALKKTPSSQQLQSSRDELDSGAFHFRRDSHDADADADADADSLDEYAEKLRQSNSLLRQKSLQREQPTRRSLLSVRFAD